MGAKIRRVILEITSWRGWGGIHYYGKLHYDGDRGDERLRPVPLSRTLQTKAEVDKLNGLESTKPGSFEWKIGYPTEKFDTKEELEVLAVPAWRKHFPKAQALVVGATHDSEPLKPLDGDPKILKKLQSYWKRYAGSTGKKRDRLCDEHWDWICGK